MRYRLGDKCKSTPERLDFFELDRLQPKGVAALHNWLYASVSLLYHARIKEVRHRLKVIRNWLYASLSLLYHARIQDVGH